MRQLIVVALAAVLCGWSSVVYAACPNGQVLKSVGSARTATGAISSQGQDAHYIQGSCTGTACAATLYDGDENSSEFTDATVRAEPSAAASGFFSMDLTESPLYFSDGVWFHDDGNVQGIVLLSCQPR